MQCDITVILICISTLFNICSLEQVKIVIKIFYYIIWNVLDVGTIKKWREISMHRAFNSGLCYYSPYNLLLMITLQTKTTAPMRYSLHSLI